MSLTLPGFDDDDDDVDDNEEEKISENEVEYNLMPTQSALNRTLILCIKLDIVSYFQPSPRGSDRLLKNLHLDLDALGGGLQYEVDEAI